MNATSPVVSSERQTLIGDELPGAEPEPEPDEPAWALRLGDDDAAGADDASHVEQPAPDACAGCTPAASDEQLAAWIERVADRDERALAALYDATVSRVYGLALRIVRRPAWAEEVAEDTYFQVWRQAARFDATRGRALTWLLAMTRSRAIDALRRETRFVHDSLDADEAPVLEDPSSRAADEWLDAAQGHVSVHRALLSLSGQPRQLVALAFFRGLSHEEIATQTSLPLGTVKSQIRRALITLRQVLGDAELHALAAA